MNRRLRLNAFVMATPTHNNPTQWRNPRGEQLRFNELELWTSLASRLEAAAFDGIFFADILGLQGAFRGNWDEHIEKGLDYPTNDPLPIVAALASTTQRIGLAFTNSIIQGHPVTFARQLATLDHLSGGRIGWNIVTSSLENSHRNVSLPGLIPHDERYRRAEEYVDAVLRILESSPDDPDELGDTTIVHHGEQFGFETNPALRASPQRTPFLFLAGASPQGQQFAGRYAEAQFIASPSPERTAGVVERIRSTAVAHGRLGSDVLLFQGFSFIIGSTEEEARRLADDESRYDDPVSRLVQLGGTIGVDFGRFDLDEPIDHASAQGGLGPFQGLLAANGGSITVRQLIERPFRALTGTPETLADQLEQWRDAGVDGINVGNHVIPGTFDNFIDHLLPELQRRGLAQRDYEEGTLRRRLTGGSDRLNARHPGARHRIAGKDAR